MKLEDKIAKQFEALRDSSVMKSLESASIQQSTASKNSFHETNIRTMSQRKEYMAARQRENAQMTRLRTNTANMVTQQRFAQHFAAQKSFALREEKGLTGFNGFVGSLPLNLGKFLLGGTLLAGTVIGAKSLLNDNAPKLTEPRMLWAGIDSAHRLDSRSLPSFLADLKESLPFDKQVALMNFINNDSTISERLSRNTDLLSAIAMTFPTLLSNANDENLLDVKLSSKVSSNAELDAKIYKEGRDLSKLDAALASLGMDANLRDDVIGTILTKGTTIDVGRIANAALSVSNNNSPFNAMVLGNELMHVMGESQFENLVSQIDPTKAPALNKESRPELSNAPAPRTPY